MKAYELPVKMTRQGMVEVPAELTGILTSSKNARMILLIEEADDLAEPKAWTRLTEEQFLKGYGEADAIYDTMD